jgi:hypothetical protein
MSDKPLPFVITDRRKFNTDGEPRPDADPKPERETRSPGPIEMKPASPSVAEMPHPPAPLPVPQPIAEAAEPEFQEAAATDVYGSESESDLPPAPSDEQMEQSRLAYNATADRIDTAIRAANPGGEHPPAMSFEQLVQSVYMQAILQLGGGTRQGEQPQIDLMGARQSIDMLGILLEKTRGNLAASEKTLVASALFELRLAFLEVTQALARSAQQRNPAGGPPPGRPGPSIVR